MKQLYMGSTEISAEKSAAEIVAVLVKAGATQVATDYDSGKIRGLRWTMRLTGRDFLFAMPARVEPVFQIIHKERIRKQGRWAAESKFADRDRQQAERVAWRQLLRWVQAQMAMIETGMVQAHEVFLPYLEMAPGRTVFSHFEETQLKQIEAPKQ